MLPYYVRFGRRHRIPSTVEILDELRSGLVPSYVRRTIGLRAHQRCANRNARLAPRSTTAFYTLKASQLSRIGCGLAL